MADDDGGPVRQMLKVIAVLRCAAGHADRPGVGEPIVIVTVADVHGDIESLLVPLSDARSLSCDLAAAIQYHDERPAHCPDVGPKASLGDPSLFQSSRPDTGGLPPLPFVLRRRQSPRGKIVQYPIFGGYRNEDSEFVLYRFYADATGRNVPMDSILRLGRPGTYRIGCLTDDEHLPIEDWAKFKKIAAGGTFRVGKTVWRKMTIPQLRHRLEGKILRLDTQ